MFSVHVVFTIYSSPSRAQQAPALISSPPANFNRIAILFYCFSNIMCRFASWTEIVDTAVTKHENFDVVKQKLGYNLIFF